MTTETYTDIHIEPAQAGKVYLSVADRAFTNFLVPFFSLPETGAQPHEDGWLIPTDKLTVLHPFLDMASESHEDMKASPREATKARVFWVSQSELPLLVSLYALPKLNQELQTFSKEGREQEEICWILASIVSEMIPTLEDYITASVGNIQAFLELEARFIKAKYDDVRRGDLCKHESQQYRNSATFIYDGYTFTSLYFGVDAYGSLPPAYQCPEPFPVTYWKGLIEHNILVWPNFERFGEKMTFEPEPPAPDSKVFDWYPPSEFKDRPYKAALRWESDGKVYRIYFYSQVPLTEAAMKANQWTKARYHAVVETEIIADVEFDSILYNPNA